jgi:uncharacterized protein (TIGR04255 family)
MRLMIETRVPIRITPCPISEAIFEIRFIPGLPEEAVFGVVYNSVKNRFDDGIEKLFPIELPDVFREQDPNLRYAVQYRIRKENLVLGIGPRSLAFSNTGYYLGWPAWSGFFKDTMEVIRATGIIRIVERTGLRYINLFERKILDDIELHLDLKGKPIRQESTHIRTELLEGGIVSIVQVSNDVDIKAGSRTFRGSAIDIDCLANLGEHSDSFFSHAEEVIERSHNREKEIFFSLLSPATLAALSPEYEELP